MATRIRLQRRGRKGYPFYHIVIADQRAPRDGKFIEKIGTYNPNVNPIALEVDIERALYWLGVGAEPTDTARNLLSTKGVMMKKHLLGGVAKGAFSVEEAEKKFDAWLSGKDKESADLVSKKEAKAKADAKARHDAEIAANKAKAEEVAKKSAEANVQAVVAVEEVVVEAVTEAPVVVEAVTEAPVVVEVATETPVVEEAAPEAPVVVEVATETPVVEEAVSEVKEEAPKAEEKSAE